MTPPIKGGTIATAGGPFVPAVLLGSFLLFLIQPMVGRLALPRLGGAPAVWLSAMLVYQALLLAGYAYAHRLGAMAPARARWVHGAVLGIAALWLPVGLWTSVPTTGVTPLLSVPALLILSIGPLFLAVSAGAPLLQRWYAAAHPGRDPYPLYAASNLGSFAGLLAYPLVLEPLLPLRDQALIWSALYGVLALLIAWTAWRLPPSAPAEAQERGQPLGARRIATWILLAAVPSGLMLSTTSLLTTDLVALPLIWVVPLGLYLLSYTVAFAARRTFADAVTLAAPVLLLMAGAFTFMHGGRQAWLQAGVGVLALFAIAVALHARLFALRPAPARLTAFYLALAAGGALGGLFTALLAPLLFDWTWEHPLLLLSAALLLPQRPLLPALDALWAGRAGSWRARWAALLIVALAFPAAGLPLASDTMEKAAQIAIVVLTGLATGRRLPFTLGLAALMLSLGGLDAFRDTAAGIRERSFFGVYTVTQDGGARTLMHGTTKHGVQRTAAGATREPTTYYAPRSGVGLALAALPDGAEVGVVGLGTGTLACYRRGRQRYSIYEIDPTVLGIAREKFTFLARCAPDARLVIGDARLSLAAEPPRRFDALAVDAFSSDAIPTHLITREAFETYRRVLKPGGVLLVHISNRYLDLQPVLAAIARVDGWHTAVRDYGPTDEEAERELSRSVWVAMTRDRATLDRLVAGSGEAWDPIADRRGIRPWSDDYASVLPLLKFD